ncbi:putative isomerase YraM [Pseudocercospora fuligena]|uniref:Putative isomerase YraM n=1 Tax=Pseudocercospora fuligena TaxID=685502 RepID=A0A8H6RQV1_9PEZI|nr:putative isomerase YraM [Pseudocercospora fuligena]
MGSADSDPRQLNGIAGATSTTSKVAIVAPSSKPGIDIEYTFIQVSIGSPQLDFTGNCGNIASGVGPFAIDEGLVPVTPGRDTINVRILNTNTGRVLVETMEIDQVGHFAEDGDYTLAGTFSTGSTIGVAFEKPAGAMTGSLLPSGNTIDSLCIPGTIVRPTCVVQASLIDAANPFVLVDASTLPAVLHDKDPHSTFYLDFIEDVRRQGAVAMGLARDVQEAAKTRGTPKIAILSSGKGETSPEADLEVTAFSMGRVHGSLQLTGAVCLSTATLSDDSTGEEP